MLLELLYLQESPEESHFQKPFNYFSTSVPYTALELESCSLTCLVTLDEKYQLNNELKMVMVNTNTKTNTVNSIHLFTQSFV